MSQETDIELFTVERAKRILRDNGPQEFVRLCVHIGNDVVRWFPGSESFSRRHVVRRTLEHALERGALVVSWDCAVGDEHPTQKRVTFTDTDLEATK